MTRAALARLRADRRGVATIEFTLWSVLFFVVALVALDFGMYHIEAKRADEGVATAALHAFDTASSVDYAGMQGYVRALAGDDALAVTTLCNGLSGCTNANRACACLNGSGGYAPQACGTTCNGAGVTAGSTAGYYLTIRASRSYAAMVVPNGMLDGARISRAATVRLQ